MSKFKLYIKHGKDLIPLTFFESNKSTILTSSTYEEEIKEQTNNYFELTFKMSYYIETIISDAELKIQKNTENNVNPLNGVTSVDFNAKPTRIKNPLFESVLHGTQLRLIDKNGIAWDSIVTEMSYDFKQDNIIVSFTAIDIFSYQMSRRNLNYTIANDDSNFIGALSLDDWAYKIKKECKINWTYNPVDSQNNQLMKILAAENNTSTSAQSFNDIKSFSISGSNAYDALVKLGEAFGMQLKLNYEQQTFGFIPTKKPINRGFYLNPSINLQSLQISTDGKSQTTVLNICGPTDSFNNEITILGTIPASILNWFGSTTWKDSKYYTFSAGKTYSAADFTSVGLDPAKVYCKKENDSYLVFNDFNMYGEYLLQQLFTACATYFGPDNLNTNYLYSSSTSLNTYVIGSVNYEKVDKFSDLENAFLSTITIVPFLENKLIDISYYKNTNIISDVDYNEWWNLLYNKIRIANGTLIYRANKKLEDVKLLNSLSDSIYESTEELNASLIGSLTQYLELDDKGDPGSKFYEDNANNLLLNLKNISNPGVTCVESYVTYYQSLLDNDDQTFLSNLYEFENYWDSNLNLNCELSILNNSSQFEGTNNTQSSSENGVEKQRSVISWAPIQRCWSVYSFYYGMAKGVSDLNKRNVFTFDIERFASSATKEDRTSDTLSGQYVTGIGLEMAASLSDPAQYNLVVNYDSNKVMSLSIGEVTADLNNISSYFVNLTTSVELSKIDSVVLECQIINSVYTNIEASTYINNIRLYCVLNDNKAVTNGVFFTQNYTKNNLNTVTKCAEINTKLSGYWNNSYLAGVNAGYWVPKDWSSLLYKDKFKTSANTPKRWLDPKFNPLVERTKTITDATTKVQTICSLGFGLNYNFIPKVYILNDSESTDPISSLRPETVTPTKLQKITWTFNSKYNLGDTKSWIRLLDVLEEDENVYGNATLITLPQPRGIYFLANDAESPDYAKINPATVNDFTPQWWLQPLTGFTKVRYVAANNRGQLINHNDIGCSLAKVLVSAAILPAIDPFIAGLDEERLNVYYALAKQQKYNNEYETALENQRKLWTEMYTTYDNLIVENTYTNDSALTPQLLLKAAQNKFNELSEPEPNYNVSMLDVYNENASIRSNIEITDQIHLNTQETGFVLEYNEYNALPKTINKDKLICLLNKTLFITGISYSLRTDEKVSITVNPVRYGDILIDRLAKLL
jgi:hypothetical protein